MGKPTGFLEYPRETGPSGRRGSGCMILTNSTCRFPPPPRPARPPAAWTAACLSARPGSPWPV